VFNLNQAFDTNAIPGTDIIKMARLLWTSPMSLKAFILFKIFDNDDNDRISVDEIRSFYENYFKELKIFKDQQRLREVVNIFLQGVFTTNNEVQEQEELNFDQFYDILQRNPDVFKSLYLIGIPDQDKEEEKEMSWYQRCWKYTKNNTSRIVCLVLYILSLIALTGYIINHQIVDVKVSSPWQVIARIGGGLVNYNFAVTICLMLKQTMTIIRRIYFLRSIIPVDDHIDAHRLVGTVLFISGVVHTFGYIVYFATHTESKYLSLLLMTNLICLTIAHSWAESMFTTAAEMGWVHNSAPITGDILVLLLIIMFIFSLQCIRQRPGFYRVFYYTHFLFWPIFILLVIHAKEFWKWAVGPMSLFILEKIYLLKRHLPNYGRTRLKLARIEDANVITLIIERPKYFAFRTGEYINVCLPNIGK
jgi:hypothetical protein